MQFIEARGLLIGVGESCEPGVFVESGEKGDRNRSARATDVIVVAVVDIGWLGRIVATQSVGHDQRRMTGEIRSYQLHAARRRDDDIDLVKERRDLLNS